LVAPLRQVGNLHPRPDVRRRPPDGCPLPRKRPAPYPGPMTKGL